MYLFGGKSQRSLRNINNLQKEVKDVQGFSTEASLSVFICQRAADHGRLTCSHNPFLRWGRGGKAAHRAVRRSAGTASGFAEAETFSEPQNASDFVLFTKKIHFILN